MAQIHHISEQLLESGVELISGHVRWLIRNMLFDHFDSKVIDVISYRTDVPVDEFGEACAPIRGICINLIKHFDHIAGDLEEIDKLEKDNKKRNLRYHSIKFRLLKELLDTAAHEAHHLEACDRLDNWDENSLEEEEATKLGKTLSWLVAKNYDVEVENFGELLDDNIAEWIERLRKIVDEAPDGELPEWATLQLYMYDNKLAYYNPDNDNSLNFRAAFELGAQQIGEEDPWINEPRKYIEEMSTTGEPETTPIAQNGEVQQSPMYHPNPMAPEAPNAPAATPPSAPVTNQTTTAGFDLGYEEYVNIDDESPEGTALNSPYEGGMYQSPAQPVQPVQPAMQPIQPAMQPQPAQPVQQPMHQPMQQNPAQTQAAPTAPALNYFEIGAAVYRKIFQHVQTKCGFNTEGGFNNPHAALEAINISDIPGADQVFVAMDCMDATGTYKTQVQCQGQIKGLVTAQNLPRYSLYMVLEDGRLHKRTFIAQNPSKKDPTGQNYTAWAQAAQNGDRIMMLLKDGSKAPVAYTDEYGQQFDAQGNLIEKGGMTAYIRLNAGQTLGQEVFSPADKK